MQWTTDWWQTATIVGVLAAALPVSEVSAHTESDYVAVPAGSTVTVTLGPEHGCDDSPTIDVRVQAPVEGAVAGEVEGWTSSATPDGAGHTVLHWEGGSTPADEEGAFPAEFTVPDAVGSLLAFPTVQRCDNGMELAWIGTAPGDELPAPQLLVLAAGSTPATTLDEVPADAPGRDLLVAVLAAESGEEVGAPPTAAPATSTTVTTTATAAPAPAASAVTTDDSDGGSSTGVVLAVIVAAVVVVVGGGTVFLRARRRARSEQP